MPLHPPWCGVYSSVSPLTWRHRAPTACYYLQFRVEAGLTLDSTVYMAPRDSCCAWQWESAPGASLWERPLWAHSQSDFSAGGS